MDRIFWERSVSLSAILKIVDLLSADVESILRVNQYLEEKAQADKIISKSPLGAFSSADRGMY